MPDPPGRDVPGSDVVVLPRLRSVRAAAPLGWAARAFVRTVEEAAYDPADLQAGRTLARSGRLGAVMVLPGMASVAGPTVAGDRVLAQLKVAALGQWDVLVRETAREARYLAELEAGRLPEELAADAEEAGVELVPVAADLETACTCDAWVQPCRHTLALLLQLARHLDVDPYVLLLLRGRTREWFTHEVGVVSRASDTARRLLRDAEEG